MLPTDCLHLLTIDFERATAPIRDAFAISSDERRELLLGAGSSTIPLLLLGTSQSLQLVSTSQNHVRAFRPALTLVQRRTGAIEGARAVPVRVTRGREAARQFLRQATPFSQLQAEAQRFVAEMRTAASLSSDCGAFSTELGALLAMTEHTAQRIDDETRLGHPGSLPAERELEALAAERIVEEELVSWQSSDPLRRPSVPPLSERDIDLFPAEEPQSVVRLRVARVLTKLRTA